ncbi:hypothetical protein F750_6732 [Streptomyces sp. PAMC 26508]|nr:hypothetical protein F750_6732 [Streptomyces sp. PAMC 26508]
MIPARAGSMMGRPPQLSDERSMCHADGRRVRAEPDDVGP